MAVCGLEAKYLDKTRSLKTSKQHTHTINLWAKRRVKHTTSSYGVVPGNDLRRNGVLRMFFRNEKGCTHEFNDRLNWLYVASVTAN